MARKTLTDERWETGNGDGAGVYLVGDPRARTRIGHFGEGGKVDSALAVRRATLAAAAPDLLEALRPLAAWAALRPVDVSDDDPILHAAGLWPITWGDATRAASAIAKTEGR